MKIRVGLVGLPNVGKSTLFNSLARQSIAEAANYPFCTIEPNTSPIPLPHDDLLRDLKQVAGSTKTLAATLDFVDVAGLCQGAHRGEGLGNRFLGTIRECSAICHVVRVFPDAGDVTHVQGEVDPVADADVVNLELLLADLQHIERRLDRITKCQGLEQETLEQIKTVLEAGKPARSLELGSDALHSIKSMGLLTLKPVLYCFNVDEVDFTLGREEMLSQIERIFQSIEHAFSDKDMFALVSAKLEAELTSRETEDQVEYLESLGMEDDENNLDQLLSYKVLPRAVAQLLRLGTVFTGPGVPPERSKTTKAHIFRTGLMTASDLAGRLHGEIEKGFLRAEVINAAALATHASFAAAKDAGEIRSEGREYLLQPDDVVHIKWK